MSHNSSIKKDSRPLHVSLEGLSISDWGSALCQHAGCEGQKGQRGGANTRRHVAAWHGPALWKGGTRGNQRGLARLHSGLGLLMAFQVWGCHLSAWLMSAPWGSFSFRHPSLHHQRKSTARPDRRECAPGIKLHKWNKHFKLAGRAGSVLWGWRNTFVQDLSGENKTKLKGKTWHSHFVHNRRAGETAKNHRKQDRLLRFLFLERFQWSMKKPGVRLSSLTTLSDSYWSLASRIQTGNIKSREKREKVSDSAYVRERTEWVTEVWWVNIKQGKSGDGKKE